jgi:thiol-disulfide isomerase/thioredoxin
MIALPHGRRIAVAAMIAALLAVATAVPAIRMHAPRAVAAASPAIAIGRPAPPFAYRLLSGGVLHASALRGRPYLLWAVATWCPSCVTGSALLARHIAEIERAHAAVVELELYDDLGGSGPPLESVRRGVGAAAFARDWYWGILTEDQTAVLDPTGTMDIYYVVDARGRIVAQGMAPAAHWESIAPLLGIRHR